MEHTGTWQQALRGIAAELRGVATGHVLRAEGVRGGTRPFLVFRHLKDHPRPALIISPTAKAAERFADDLRFFFGEEATASPFARRVHHLPAWDVVPFEDVSPPADVLAARVEGLYHLQQSQNPIIVTTPEALLLRVPPVAEFAKRNTRLIEGEEIDRDLLGERLIDWGYRRVGLVEDRGDFSIRGGIVDIFPPAHANPVRLQLDGDTIESMHDFDPVSQRLINKQPELLLLPVREFSRSTSQQRDVLRAIGSRADDLEIGREEKNLILNGLESGLLFPGAEFCLPYFYESLGSVFDYVPASGLIWVDSPGEVDSQLEKIWSHVEKRAAERGDEHHFFPPPELLYLGPASFRDALRTRTAIELESLDMMAGTPRPGHFSIHSFSTTDLKLKREHQRNEITFGPIAERIRGWIVERQRIFFVASTEAQAHRFSRLLETHSVTAETTIAPFAELLENDPGVVYIVIGHLSDGFRLPDDHLIVITETDVFGESRRRAARKVSVAQLLKNLSELKPNDHMVHIDHGVGIYRGLKHLKVADTEGDYLHLEYLGGDRLYLPVDRISLVQKYVGSDGAAPVLDKLGGSSWSRVKAKTKESILAMANELLAIYAAREVNERRAYAPPDSYYREFEAAFPFEETPDQKNAIDDVMGDMLRTKPMDRLICGDVGYGKTEVALRAAFLAANDGKQVAVLVPTTVLAHQHLQTFRKRLDGYPMRVEMLSRFLTPAESKDVVKGLKAGTVDIVIGTHRLLQKDIDFKNLGLLVIDEEHRFGVKHKERVKEMRKLVDCLTLTATPIPRTLQLSLMGIRDLSVIETPPVDRLAVRTYVTRYDEDIIRDAILRELSRKGQVFFVHNRVENIGIMAQHLGRLVPEARIAVAHGQMNEHQLEKVMLGFIQRDFDVLLCTAIIESGLDIPKANTILINRADHFGLAQLYQLRGRVGRSNERAYAYLMIPGEHLITKDAQTRLKVLQELDDLGGGFKLAAQDLEIRGAGNMLGKQQSGHITSVGFELYTQMMEDAVQQLRGQQVRVDVEPEIQLGFAAFIPDTYIADENQRVVFYRRLAGIQNAEELEDLSVELVERYGPIPPLVDSFLRVMDLRRYLKESLVLRAINRNGTMTLQFHPEAPVNVDTMMAMAANKRLRGKFKLSQDFQLSFTPESKDWDGIINELKDVLKQIRAPLPPRADGDSPISRAPA